MLIVITSADTSNVILVILLEAMDPTNLNMDCGKGMANQPYPVLPQFGH